MNELNSKVAEAIGWAFPAGRCRVCGWELKESVREGCTAKNCSQRPAPATRADQPADYSGDLNAAMRAYQVIRKRGWILIDTQDRGLYWGVELYSFHAPGDLVRATGDTLAEALCNGIVEAAEKERAAECVNT